MRPAVRHALALLVVALAAAARAAADVDPLAVLDGYSLFARDKLLASTLHLANGNLGVSRGPLLCTGTLDAESSVVVATKVALAPRTSVCDTLIANRVRTDAADCSVADGFHAPLVPDLRAACRFPAPFPACDRAKPIAVRRGETVTLPPGVYGAVGSRRKPAAGTLVLGGRGRFVFCDVTMARKAALVVTEPAEVDVAGNAALGFVQFTGVAGPALDPDGRRVPGVPTELRFFVGGRSVRIGTAASLPHLCAPAATLGVARGATLEGSFVARVVDVRHVAGTVAISSTPRCGDATPDAEEECDDGNNVDGDGCESDCTLPACGDGVLEDDEECDDGNDQDGDGCESDCTLPFCGNGVVDPGEACDDGNDDGDDDCEPDCTPTPAPPVCGDGQVDPDERCDDGNDEDGDGCESDCTPTPGPPACGNGVVEGDEECDDGNDVAGDGCERDCTATPPPAFVRDLGGSQTKALASHVAVAIPDEPVPVGHTVVAMVAMPNVAGRVACGDTAGNRYAIDAEATNPDAAGGGLRTVICSAYVTRELRPSAAPMGAPGDEVFFDYPTAKATVLAVYEFEHLSPHPVHESLAAHDAGAGPEPPLFFTTTTSDALVLASIATATNLLRTVTPGDGWTALTPFATSGSGRNSALFPECLVTPGGDVPIGWRFGGGHQWALAAVALR